VNRRHRNSIASPTRRRAARRGTAATEFALVLPVLIVIALGCVDLGRGIHDQIALSNAVREGAMYGATRSVTPYSQSTWEQEIRDRVTDELANMRDFRASDLTVDINAEMIDEEDVRLTITATYLFETIVDWPGLPHQISLRHEMSARRYR